MQNLMRQTFLFCLLAGLVGWLPAQKLDYGFQAGLNLHTFARPWIADSVPTVVQKPEAQFKPGYSLGFLANFTFNPGKNLEFFVEGGLLFDAKGYRWKLENWPVRTVTTDNSGNLAYLEGEMSGTVRVTGHYASLPFRVGGSLPLGPGRLEVFAGFYGAFLLGGVRKEDLVTNNADGSQEISQADLPMELVETYPDTILASKYYISQDDNGLEFGIGYHINDFRFRIDYSHGLENIIPQGLPFDRDAINDKNRVIRFTVGYYFPVFK